MKKVVSLIIALLMIVTFEGNAYAAAKDDWNVYYYSGAPSYISHPTEALTVTYYGDGFRAKATNLSGSYNRRVCVEGRDGITINGGDIMITVAGVLTSPFHTSVSSHSFL